MSQGWLAARRREEIAVIRQRIGLALLNMALVAIIWAVLAAFVYGMEQRQALAQVDRQLTRLAQEVSVSAGRRAPRDLTQLNDVHEIRWSPKGTVRASYEPFPAQAMPAVRAALLAHDRRRPAYYSLTVVGIPYRVRQWRIAGGGWLQLFDGIRDDRSRLARLLTLLIWGGAIGLVLSLVGGFIMGLWTLQPIFRARRREQAFLSDVSHELRTPLAALRAHVDLLIRHADDPIGDHLPWLETLYGETERMTRLVNELLEVGRLEEGARALNLEPVSLRDLVETVAAIYRPVLEEAGLGLDLAVPEDAAVLGDPERLRQLLLIFLDNAKKHTRHGGVVLAVVVRGGSAEVHVKDSGDGLAEMSRRRAGGSDDHPLGSPTGRGLLIAQKIVQVHGATLAFHSKRGQGTDVVVTFRTLHPRRRRPL